MKVLVTNMRLDAALDRPFVYFDVETALNEFSTGEYLVDGRLTWEDGNMFSFDEITLHARQIIAEEVEEWLAAGARPKKCFEITANGTPMGSYAAYTREAAILEYVHECGYDDIIDAASVLGITEEDFLAAVDVDEVQQIQQVEGDEAA